MAKIYVCGTRAGARRHRQRGEQSCEPCLLAERAYARELYRANREHKRKLAREWESRNPGLRREVRARWVLKKYGITPDDYREIYARQEGRCAVCRDPHPGIDGGEGQRLHVDHDHKSGRVRGLLCMACNTGIGKLGDGALLPAAMEYLAWLP